MGPARPTEERGRARRRASERPVRARSAGCGRGATGRPLAWRSGLPPRWLWRTPRPGSESRPGSGDGPGARPPRVGLVMWHHVHGPMPLLVDQDRRIRTALTECPLVHDEDVNRVGRRVGLRVARPDHGVCADRQPLVRCDPGHVRRTGRPPPGDEVLPHGDRPALPEPGPGGREPLTKDRAHTSRIVTPEPSAAGPPLDWNRVPRQILQRARVEAVDAGAGLAATGAHAVGAVISAHRMIGEASPTTTVIAKGTSFGIIHPDMSPLP